MVAIEAELSQLFVFIGQSLVVSLELTDLILSSSNQRDVAAEDAVQVPGLVIRCIDHEQLECLHHAKVLIVAAKRERQLLAFAVVIEQLLVLVADMVDHLFILLGAVCEDLETLGSHHGSRHQLLPCLLLQSILLVREVEFPLVESMRQVSLLVLLSVSNEVKPVLDYFPKGNEAPPPVEHLRFQIIIRTIHALPSADGASKKLKRLF